MTVSKAYALLKKIGFISTDRRQGTRVLPVEHVEVEHIEKSLPLVVAETITKGMDKSTYLKLCEKMLENTNYVKSDRLI